MSVSILIMKKKFNNRIFFENRAKKGIGFHYADRWQNLYAFKIRAYALKKIGEFFFDATVVDVGCGGGLWFPFWKSFFVRDVIGLEQSKFLADNAFIKTGVFFNYRTYVTDITKKSKFDLSVDVAVLITVFNYTDPEKRGIVLENIKSLLKPGGYLVLLDEFPRRVPSYQKNLSYKSLMTDLEVENLLIKHKIKIVKIVPVNYVRNFLFFHFGSNRLIYLITYFFDRLLLRLFPVKLSKEKVILAKTKI